jgi:hypothetical protein
MAERTLLDSRRPITQSIDAVKVLLTWKGRGSNPLPAFVEMGKQDRVVLVLSSKQDAYYVVTQTACSCPSATYRAGPCKHRLKHFPKTAGEDSEDEKPAKYKPVDEGFDPALDELWKPAGPGFRDEIITDYDDPAVV